MKRFWKGLLALTLICVMLWGDVAALAAPLGGNQEGASFASAAQAQMTLLAKSKKKKTTAAPKATGTPTPQATKTPAPTATPTSATPAKPTATPVPDGPITDPQSIADWLFAHDMRLPDNFITKKQAQALGWDSSYNYVSDVAPGKSIGGDYFGNYEGKLPMGKGISYHEADCYYTKGRRNAYRVIYSSDGRVWYTEDHYNTFTELFPTNSQ